MSVWFFSGEDKCPITFLSPRPLSIIFCNLCTSCSRSCDWLFIYHPSLHLTDKHSRSCLLLASFAQHSHWEALAKEVPSYFRVQNYCFYLISTFWLFLGHTCHLKCHSTMGSFFFHFIITLLNFQVYFFHCVLQNLPFALSTSLNTGELPPRNQYGHYTRVSTTLKLEKHVYCFMRLNGFPNSKCYQNVSRNGGQMRQ